MYIYVYIYIYIYIYIWQQLSNWNIWTPGACGWDPELHYSSLLLYWTLKGGLQNFIVIQSWEMWKKEIRSSPKVCFCFTLMVQIWASHLCLYGSIFSSLNESFGPVIFLRSHPALTIHLARIPFKILHFCLSQVIYFLILSSYTLYPLVL